MAEWCNASLTVVGPRADVARFARRARKKPPGEMMYLPDILVIDSEVTLLPRQRGRAEDIFIPDMWVGEGGDLWSERARVIGPDLRRKSYHFQIRNDDGREHFRGVSTRYPSLHLVLVNYWGLPSECSSFLIHGGRSRAYRMPDELVNSILMKHGYDPDLDSDNDDEHMENDDKEWEASWEMMDVAESRWLDGLLRRIRQA